MPREKTALASIIDREALQQLQDSVSKTADISTIILDSSGNPITKLTNPRGICRLLGNPDKPGGICRKTRKELCRMARDTRKPSAMLCPLSGMTGVAIPIFLDDEFLGAWIIGQVRLHGDPPEPFEQAAREAGLDPAESRKLLEDIPVFSRPEFEMVVDFMSIVTGEIVKRASGNIKLTENNRRLAALSEELNQLAFFDRTLQIPNAERMDQDMRAERCHEYLVAVAFADLRRINNFYGRACGDALLRTARDYILELDIPDSTLYRGRVSDFCVLFRNTGGKDDLPLEIAEKIHARSQKAWELPAEGRGQHISAPAHVCVFPLDGYHDNLLNYLSSAMEHCIGISRRINGVVVYDDDVRDDFHAGLRLELSLKNAVCENMRGFSLAYQPIVDMKAAMWKGVEALCRWDSPEFGSVPPGVFIPVAEASGLIGSIGLWVLEQAVAQVKAWGLDANEGFLLEVNLSPVQFAAPDFDQTVIELIKKYDYPPEKLGLEVTESSELNFSKRMTEAVARLSGFGIVIVLDDFGTGYSSLSSLHKLPAKIIKTDRAFITGMESDGRLQKLLYVMVSLAHGTDMKLVAEGVENDLQARILLKQGADFFQGYFFSRPLTAAQLSEKLDNFNYPIEHLASMGYTKWENDPGESGAASGEYGLPPAMHQLLNGCLREIFTNPDSGRVIDALLANTGQSLNVSRSYVFLKEPDGSYSNTNEWRAPGIRPEKGNLRHMPLAGTKWADALKRNGLWAVSDIRTLESGVCDALSRQDIKAIVEFPLWKNNELYGFVGFDDCADAHVWTREEVQMLHTLAGLITCVLGKTWLQDEVAALYKTRESVPGNINTLIFVSDLETNEILFANTELHKMYDYTPLTGRVCWEALHNRKERCRFCPIPHLLKNPGKSYTWEVFNEALGKRLRVQDSIIPWLGGKLAHLEYAVDISMYTEA